MPVAPPFPRLPSLKALRAFEAAARLGGFTQAAEELRVTPGAITAQIKTLENEMGAKLFVRQAQGVSLTDIGARALPALTQAFDQLGQAVRDLRQDAAPQRVHIAALPAVAQLWLSPRLSALRKRLPAIEISVTALEVAPNLKRVPFDICLFYASHPVEGAVVLAKDHLLPVCAPQLARDFTVPQDLAGAICLSDGVWVGDWISWSTVAMPDVDFTPRGPVFSLYALAVQEALNGAGVLIARESLVASLLDDGRLVAPFDIRAELPELLVAWAQRSARQGRGVQSVLTILSELA